MARAGERLGADGCLNCMVLRNVQLAGCFSFSLSFFSDVIIEIIGHERRSDFFCYQLKVMAKIPLNLQPIPDLTLLDGEVIRFPKLSEMSRFEIIERWIDGESELLTDHWRMIYAYQKALFNSDDEQDRYDSTCYIGGVEEPFGRHSQNPWQEMQVREIYGHAQFGPTLLYHVQWVGFPKTCGSNFGRVNLCQAAFLSRNLDKIRIYWAHVEPTWQWCQGLVSRPTRHVPSGPHTLPPGVFPGCGGGKGSGKGKGRLLFESVSSGGIDTPTMLSEVDSSLDPIFEGYYMIPAMRPMVKSILMRQRSRSGSLCSSQYSDDDDEDPSEWKRERALARYVARGLFLKHPSGYETPPQKQRGKFPRPCLACDEGQFNQEAHYGGCMLDFGESDQEEEVWVTVRGERK